MNIHKNVTADGVVVEAGLRVRTNDWTVGHVIEDSTSCHCTHDHPAQTKVGGSWYSDHPAANRLVEAGCYCRHDHWFTVEFEDGTSRQYNGERMTTRV